MSAQCGWCGFLVPSVADPIGPYVFRRPELPAAEDDLGWRRVGKSHAPDCEWVKCRAWQKKVDDGV